MDNKQKAIDQKQRLEKLAIHLKMNIVDLAAMAGLNKNTLYHIGSGIRGCMSERTAARLCYHLEKKYGIILNRQWLLDGIGDMFDTEYPITPYSLNNDEPISVAAEEGADYNSPDYRHRYLSLLEDYINLQKKYTSLLEQQK